MKFQPCTRQRTVWARRSNNSTDQRAWRCQAISRASGPVTKNVITSLGSFAVDPQGGPGRPAEVLGGLRRVEMILEADDCRPDLVGVGGAQDGQNVAADFILGHGCGHGF